MQNNRPLADLMRPQSLSKFFGQEHLVGEGKIVRNLIESDDVPSMILWGPPGSGKTTLARIIANQTDAHFVELSATNSGVKDIHRVVDQADHARRTLMAQRTILFVDEIHRFSKAQQDHLLPYVENGTVTLIGATTENPSFEVISPLISRSRVLVLQPLEINHLTAVVQKAADRAAEWSSVRSVTFGNDIATLIAELSNGDARTALNTLELAVKLAKHDENEDVVIDKNIVKEAFQKEHLLYDKGGEEHYNTISAFIKSMRASDADAAIYYLARMIEAGADPKFIARRMVVFASEDVGLANPTALVVANAVFRACETIGYPECAINLVHGVAYLANCKKDRSAYDALRKAQADVEEHGNLDIPMMIRNAPTKLMKELGYGKDYEKYPENTSYLPEKLRGKKYL
ncbi:replication-associated recombination protein A [candidate division WWE3 bacterium]|uniref:Replication-associated recombination protein A n=1 Tax=candidate division WWE3 bacterium TaxID=2053526 RepID=A0A955LM08_UNCKA|nr:replication-associated recombination protein A [candidate division WWE3 bacterium]